MNKYLKDKFNNYYKYNFFINDFIESTVKNYLENINEKFKVFHMINNKWDSSQNLFNYSLLIPNDNDEILKIYSIPDKKLNIFSNQMKIFFHKNITIYFDYGYGDWNYVRCCPKQLLQKYIYKLLLNILPYVYDSIAKEIYDIFDISNEEYIIKFGKIFDINNNLNTNSPIFILNDYENRYMPFISFSNKNTFNIITGDIKNNERDCCISNNIIFPFDNKILSAVYFDNRKYLYESNLNNEDNMILSSTSDTYKNQISYSQLILKNEYMINEISIGNICNYLYIIIINKNTNKNFIIGYNRDGTNCKIIQNINSISSVSNFHKKNKENIIVDKMINIYNKNKTSIENSLNNINADIISRINDFKLELFEKLKEYIYNEYISQKLYKEHHHYPDTINVNEFIPLFTFDIKNNISYLSPYELFTINKNITIKNSNLFKIKFTLFNEYINAEEFHKMNYNEFNNYTDNNYHQLSIITSVITSILCEINCDLKFKNINFSVFNNLINKLNIKINSYDFSNIPRKKYLKLISPHSKYNIFNDEIKRYSHFILFYYYLKPFIIDIFNKFNNEIMDLNKYYSPTLNNILNTFNENKELRKQFRAEISYHYKNIDFTQSIQNILLEINYYNSNINLSYKPII